MTRAEFDKQNGSTFFLQFGKWGYQLTDNEATKVGYVVKPSKVTPASETKSRTK